MPWSGVRSVVSAPARILALGSDSLAAPPPGPEAPRGAAAQLHDQVLGPRRSYRAPAASCCGTGSTQSSTTLQRQLTLISTMEDLLRPATSLVYTESKALNNDSGSVMRTALKRRASLLSWTGATGSSITGNGQLTMKFLAARNVPISLKM